MGFRDHFLSDEKVPPVPPPSYPETPVGSTSAPPAQPRPGQFGTPFACLLLSRSDRIRILGFPEDVIPAIDESIQRVWVPGIQNKGPSAHQAYEWKLSGRPWYGSGAEAVPSRRLLIHVLHALAAVGWHLAFSTDLSKKGWDKDTLMFKPGPPVQKYFFAISFNESDKIRLIDSPNPHVTEAFTAAVNTWPLGIQDTREKYANCLQMKLKGNPWWTSDGAQVNYSRLLGCAVLSAMDAHGFEMIASVDMSVGAGENNPDLDTWFFANKV